MSKPANPLTANMINIGKIPADVFAKNGMLFIKQGHYVLTQEQKQRLVEHGHLTSHDRAALVEKELRERREKQEQERREQANRNSNPILEMDRLSHKVSGLLNRFFEFRHFELEISHVADSLIRLAQQHPDGLIAACLLAPARDYGSTHSLHTAAVLAILGKRLNLPRAEHHVLLCAALTMNISATMLHTELDRQQEPMNEEQRSEMYAHPLLTSAILRDLKVEDERWHLLVQQHHEDWNGGGYPYGLSKEQIDPGAHLIHLTDVLTALMTTHAHRPGHLPSVALGKLYRGDFSAFDSRFVALLIKEIGIYPPGSFVRLVNGEIAVVVQRPPEGRGNTPRVAAVRAGSGDMYGEPLPRNTALSEYAISGPVSQKEAGIRPAFLVKLWG
ncbi:HD-GYP domain-containing protein [Vogesella sp. LIG4]|uniref:HD-GYP domain-containing protein n=1 Tax=Vogesella sp. LIG4 TaxID=1192162 RepID=UPI0008202222|nr:HD domain-containing phosphohydrolase [Vogesella sp. LIG4]SCK30273.1 HD-GYP domain [Vogesella sp. LIG4]